MTRFALRLSLRLSLIPLFLCAIFLAGLSPAHSDSTPATDHTAPVINVAYRSHTALHKVIVYAHEGELRDSIMAAGGTLLEEYGAFALFAAPQEAADYLSAQDHTSSVRDDMNVLLLRAGAFDTTQNLAPQLRIAESSEPAEQQLYLIQMVGPVKKEWVEAVRRAAEIIAYVPNNAYLIRATATGFAELKDLAAAPKSFIQWSGDYKPAYKIAPEIALDADQEVVTTVQLINSKHLEEQLAKLAAINSVAILDTPASAAGYTNLRIKVDARSLAEIAKLSDVVWIEPFATPVLLDERQGLIVSGNLLNSQLQGPGYLAWLRVKGLASTPDFLVDIADSGIDKGLLDPAVIHKDFLNQAGVNRVIYARLFSFSGIDGTAQDTTGHGTLNASIVGGYNTGTSFPSVDGNGYAFGLGVHPFVKLGISKIFNPEFTNPDYVAMTDQMYRDGTRISSNSWGAYSNAYTADCQTYDSLVRDARRSETGNQEMTIVFAAGNQGPTGALTTPGSAKNVITVGASENLRPGLDGCRIPTEGADDATSMIDFSSGGFTTDGRIKPDISAPGTHIQGAKSQDRGFTGSGICGPYDYPSGQSLYSWSSGTSHAAPAVAGGAALVRQYFQQSTGTAPSPAMVKAFLTNSTSYMTGFMANDNLPGEHQGFGLMNLGRAFDDAQRILIDQTQTIANTGQTIAVRGRVSNSAKPVRVTLCWTDAPGTPAANPVVNDLDLQVIINGTTYLGNHFTGSASTAGGTPDRLNNVEAVWLPAGLSGDFEVRVIGANIAGDGIPNNSDTTDQDFALVVYNAQIPGGGSGGGGGGGGGGAVDAAPTVNLKSPVGGEVLTVGNLVRISWEAADDKAIQSQRVEFSSDNGSTYNLIAQLDGSARFFDWHIPSLPTANGRIRVSVYDGVNLPSLSVSPASFQIVNGPLDTTPPTLAILSPAGDSEIGGGTTTTIRWRETDNVGVIKRVIEYSGDNGNTFQEMTTIVAPSSGELQSFIWQVPVALSTLVGRIRITIYDGAGNATTLISTGKFTVWPLPIITDANFVTGTDGKGTLEIFGRNFRLGDTELYSNGVLLNKIRYIEKCDEEGRCKKISSIDKKLTKRLPEGQFVNLQIKIASTGQASPTFEFKRKKVKP
ncbi:MAG: S8 family serine peptidase [Acidobacteria bacterium]|nr:S8 family serine peptidase [Acidobacteriota bacterium]